MRWIVSALLLVGLLFTGCESPVFPWPNLAGIGCVCLAGLLMRRKGP